MKTTIEIPDDLFRKAKAAAAANGQSLKGFVTRALQQMLSPQRGQKAAARGWRSVLGKASRQQVRDVNHILETEFSRIDLDTWK